MSVAQAVEPQKDKETQKLPHDSAYVYSSTKGRHWYAGFVELHERERGRAEWIILTLLMVFAVLGGSFLGLVAYNTVINPPSQVLGKCPSPAYIAGNGCWIRQCVTDQNNQQTCSQIPSGNIVGPLNK